eukprot:COSAG06_NODE_56579_length_284_cov_0.718919_2_plen_59_part_01
MTSMISHWHVTATSSVFIMLRTKNRWLSNRFVGAKSTISSLRGELLPPLPPPPLPLPPP